METLQGAATASIIGSSDVSTTAAAAANRWNGRIPSASSF